MKPFLIFIYGLAALFVLANFTSCGNPATSEFNTETPEFANRAAQITPAGGPPAPAEFVNIENTFEMQTAPVTQKQYVQLMGKNPSRFSQQAHCQFNFDPGTNSCPNNPVENISWSDVQIFLAKMNQQNDGYSYRLPTEAEWEYAARGGSTTDDFFGNDKSQLGDFAWYADNSYGQTQPVRLKQPNAFGIFDILGNVWQLTSDPVIRNGSPSTSNEVRMRGGSWSTYEYICRLSTKGAAKRDGRYNDVGFRMVRTRIN